MGGTASKSKQDGYWITIKKEYKETYQLYNVKVSKQKFDDAFYVSSKQILLELFFQKSQVELPMYVPQLDTGVLYDSFYFTNPQNIGLVMVDIDTGKYITDIHNFLDNFQIPYIHHIKYPQATNHYVVFW